MSRFDRRSLDAQQLNLGLSLGLGAAIACLLFVWLITLLLPWLLLLAGIGVGAMGGGGSGSFSSGFTPVFMTVCNDIKARSVCLISRSRLKLRVPKPVNF